MVGSEIFLLNKCVRMIGGHFIKIISLDDNELFMIKCPPVTYTLIKQQQQRGDEVATIKKKIKKNNTDISSIEIE